MNRCDDHQYIFSKPDRTEILSTNPSNKSKNGKHNQSDF